MVPRAGRGCPAAPDEHRRLGGRRWPFPLVFPPNRFRSFAFLKDVFAAPRTRAPRSPPPFSVIKSLSRSATSIARTLLLVHAAPKLQHVPNRPRQSLNRRRLYIVGAANMASAGTGTSRPEQVRYRVLCSL